DEEREDVIKFIKKNNQPQTENGGEAVSELADYMNKAAEDKSAPEKSDEPGLASEYDDMLPQAVDVALEIKQVSVSMLQRRLKLGYSRAARIVDQMEELGIVGPYEGAKPRQVIVDREGWKEIEVSMGLISDADMDLALDMQDDGEDFNYSDEEN
ncbi:MAG: DNA translocase FtsK, partial [Oscillospiraceae bacterium]|nr:DNA translocase FtsK [Oscillospiraceae bacterium]